LPRNSIFILAPTASSHATTIRGQLIPQPVNFVLVIAKYIKRFIEFVLRPPFRAMKFVPSKTNSITVPPPDLISELSKNGAIKLCCFFSLRFEP
jgi:hypothetical protein